MDLTANRDGVDRTDSRGRGGAPLPAVGDFLTALRASRLLTSEELSTFLGDHPGIEEQETANLIAALVRDGLLNDYHVARLLAGQTFGLVFDNYRVLELLSQRTGHSIVFKAEHVQLKRLVALKVFTAEVDRHSGFLQRFQGALQALSVLNHPHIALTFHAGEVESPGSPSRVLRYLVREYVPGQDLERLVREHGPPGGRSGL